MSVALVFQISLELFVGHASECATVTRHHLQSCLRFHLFLFAGLWDDKMTMRLNQRCFTQRPTNARLVGKKKAALENNPVIK